MSMWTEPDLENESKIHIELGKVTWIFTCEFSAAKYLHDRFKLRFELEEEIWYSFSLNEIEIIVDVYYQEFSSRRTFKNEFDAIDYLKSLYIERLWE